MRCTRNGLGRWAGAFKRLAETRQQQTQEPQEAEDGEHLMEVEDRDAFDEDAYEAELEEAARQAREDIDQQREQAAAQQSAAEAYAYGEPAEKPATGTGTLLAVGGAAAAAAFLLLGR